LTCGDSDEQKKANYLMTRAFVAGTPDDSELLVRPLSPNVGGEYHSGGVFFGSRSDGNYTLVRDWAATAGALSPGVRTLAREFFDTQVMPVLLQRGCAAQACHSPITPHKLRLRAGSSGFFSTIAADRNYAEVHKGFIALGSDDARVSRLSIAHALIETNPERATAVAAAIPVGLEPLASTVRRPGTRQAGSDLRKITAGHCAILAVGAPAGSGRM